MAPAKWGAIVSTAEQFPHLQDVGAPKKPPPINKNWVYWVGTDGSLWRSRIAGGPDVGQVPSPGGLTRVSVSPAMNVYCVDRYGKAWLRSDSGNWSSINIPTETVIDVDVALDDSVWFVMKNGRYYVWRTGDPNPKYIGVLLNVSCVTGIRQPDLDAADYGNAWAISEMIGNMGLIGCDHIWQPGVATIQDLADLSIAPGFLWMVHTDGSVWTTPDGRIQERKGDLIASRVSTCSNVTYATSRDGRAWVWSEANAVTTPPPPPPLPSPPPQAPATQRPTISVSSSGAGESTVFGVTGSGFLPNSQVSIRVVRLGNGQVFEQYWITTSLSNGTVNYSISLPCVSGLVFHFSANDGRVDSADHTSTLWSNTATKSCP